MVRQPPTRDDRGDESHDGPFRYLAGEVWWGLSDFNIFIHSDTTVKRPFHMSSVLYIHF